MPHKTFKYRLYPSSSQTKRLLLILDMTRNFYNMMLEDRKVAWEQEQRQVTKKDQLRLVKRYKATFPQAKEIHSHILQLVVAEVDQAFQGFFRRIKAKEIPGYPRFKSENRWHSFGFKEYGNGFQLQGRRLQVSGVGRISVRWHRPLEGKLKTCRIIYKAGQWWVSLTCEVESTTTLPKTGKAVGVDVGLTALITTSDGDKVNNPRFYQTAQRKLRCRQRQLARTQKDSKCRDKKLRQTQRQHIHIANQRRDFAHKISYALVHDYDWIALEDLQISNMVKNHRFSKSILDAGWGLFKRFLAYKAASAGREVVFVDPAYTSKTCSNCGVIFEGLTLVDRWIECDCGLSLDRDHNAAINILIKSGWDAPRTA